MRAQEQCCRSRRGAVRDSRTVWVPLWARKGVPLCRRAGRAAELTLCLGAGGAWACHTACD